MNEHNILIEAHQNESLRDQAAAAGMRYMRVLGRGKLRSQDITIYATVDEDGAEWRVADVGTTYALWETEDPDGFAGLVAVSGLSLLEDGGNYPLCTTYFLFDDGS